MLDLISVIARKHMEDVWIVSCPLCGDETLLLWDIDFVDDRKIIFCINLQCTVLLDVRRLKQ